MNQRERFLSFCIGGIVLLFVVRYFWNSSQEALDSKTSEVARLRAKVEDQDLALFAGQKAVQRITKVTPLAAPTDHERAIADYGKWMIQLANEVKLANPNFNPPLKPKVEKDKFSTFSYELKGQGNLETLTHLLHKIYSKPLLQRVRSLAVTPVSTRPEDTGKFNISLNLEYLGIPTSKKETELLPYEPERLSATLAEYNQKILNRNIFSLPNNPPDLPATNTVVAHRGQPLDYTIGAKDPDPNQSVSYSLDGEAPKGLTIDPQSGKVSWVSNELGEFEFKVIAKDNGLPAKTAHQVVKVSVVPPPPPAPEDEKFNVASQSKLTGLVSGRQGAEAWIHSLTEGKTHMLRQGDELVLGELKGKVVGVGVNYVELETDGRKWTLGIDEAVIDAYRRGMVD